jgi:para-aminobenzoate synthetase/4-amino-4-deoxychorismate lyase
MVVDLLRNDLGRIAAPGTVRVPELWQVERHPTLWQLTSMVTATQRADVGLADVFGALFPCGSVTGAPKVSSMAIIADLERSLRGVCCGAVGLVQPGSTPMSGTRNVDP